MPLSNVNPFLSQILTFVEHVSELRQTVASNKGYIQSSLRRYLYFNYDITPLVQQTIKQSLENIQNIKDNYHDAEEASPPKERSRGISSMFKALVKMPEKKKESLKFSEIKGVDLKMSGKLETIMAASPFDKLMLLQVDETEADKLLLKNNKKFNGENFRQVFSDNQDEIYRKET
jgi:hypothetical protein